MKATCRILLAVVAGVTMAMMVLGIALNVILSIGSVPKTPDLANVERFVIGLITAVSCVFLALLFGIWEYHTINNERPHEPFLATPLSAAFGEALFFALIAPFTVWETLAWVSGLDHFWQLAIDDVPLLIVVSLLSGVGGFKHVQDQEKKRSEAGFAAASTVATSNASINSADSNSSTSAVGNPGAVRTSKAWAVLCAGLAWILAFFALPIVYAAGVFFLLWMRRLFESGLIVFAISTLGIAFLVASHVALFSRPLRIGMTRTEKKVMIVAFLGGSLLVGISATIALDSLMPHHLFAGHRSFNNLTTITLVMCFLAVPWGHVDYRAGNPYTAREFLARAGGILAVILLCWLGISYFVGDYKHLQAMESVMRQREKLAHQLEYQCKEYERGGLKILTSPHRAFSEYATALQAIDIGDCPKDFQQAFKAHADSWADFGQYVERNSGAVGIVQAVLTDGLSVLQAWFVQLPEKTRAIKATEQRLDEIGGANLSRSKRRLEVFESWVGVLGLNPKHLKEFELGPANDD